MDRGKIEELVFSAIQARQNAYMPYSNYGVGAAVLAENGDIYRGCNVENASYPAGMCAERNAIGAAVAMGAGKLEALAIAGSTEHFTMPCGICRQVISEFHIPLIVVARTTGDYKIFDGKDLLPYAFSESDVKK